MEEAVSFSKEWTNEERLKLIVLLAVQIQEDIPAGEYGAVVREENGVPVEFRPNMQSIIEIICAPTSVLEASRASLEVFVADRLPELEEQAKFYADTLDHMRAQVHEAHTCPACIARKGLDS